MTEQRVRSPQGAPTPPRPTRRWPDLLVGALSLAVVAGLGGLLLSERVAPKQTTAAEPQVSGSVIPSSPGTVTATSPSAPSGGATSSSSAAHSAPAGRIPPAPASPPVAEIPPPVLPKPAPISVPAPSIQTQPAAQPSYQGQTPAAQPGVQPPQTQPAQTQPPQTQPAQTQPAQTRVTQTPPPVSATPAASPRAGGAVAPSERRTPLRSDYRVMLGTFGNRASLQAATAQVSALGYTVYAIDLGNQFVAQVGPYANEATGREAVADIRRVYSRAELYLPRGQAQTSAAVPQSEATSAQPAPAQPAPAQAAESAAQEATSAPTPQPQQEAAPAAQAAEPSPSAVPASTPAPSPPAASSGLTYLQVGAFNNPEGAQRFVEQLRAQGFSPSVNAPAGRKVTVLVGPFDGAALTEAEGRLDRAGLEHFRLR